MTYIYEIKQQNKVVALNQISPHYHQDKLFLKGRTRGKH